MGRRTSGRTFVTDEVREWIESLEDVSHRLVVLAIDILGDWGPALGRPLVDRVEHSSVQNLEELLLGSAGRSELRWPGTGRVTESVVPGGDPADGAPAGGLPERAC